MEFNFRDSADSEIKKELTEKLGDAEAAILEKQHELFELYKQFGGSCYIFSYLAGAKKLGTSWYLDPKEPDIAYSTLLERIDYFFFDFTKNDIRLAIKGFIRAYNKKSKNENE